MKNNRHVCFRCGRKRIAQRMIQTPGWKYWICKPAFSMRTLNEEYCTVNDGSKAGWMIMQFETTEKKLRDLQIIVGERPTRLDNVRGSGTFAGSKIRN